MPSFIDKIKIKFNKDFKKNYDEFSLFNEVINEFIKEYGKDSSKKDYIDKKTKKDILNKNSNSFKICDFLKDYKEFIDQKDIKVIDEFLDVYSNFDDYSLKINTRYIDGVYDDFSKSKTRIKKFIENLTSNISYENLMDKNQLTDDFRDDYELSKRLIEYKSSDNYQLKDEKLIKEFIDIYLDLDNVVENINDEVERRDELFKDYSTNKTNIKEFITNFKEKVSDELYIDNSKSILDEYLESYELASNIKDLVSDDDKTLVKDFINLYDNFDDAVKLINENYLKRLYDKFILRIGKIKEFCTQYKFDVSYDVYIDDDKKNEDYSLFKNDYNVLYELKDKKFDFKENTKLVQDFINLYDNFDDEVESINQMYIDGLYDKFILRKEDINEFCTRYKFDVSYDVYIDDEKKNKDYSLFKNDYNVLYELKDKKFDFKNDSDLVHDFLDLYENFSQIVDDINKEVKRRDLLFKEYIDNKTIIDEFIYKYKTNVSLDEYIDDYQSVLNEYSSIYQSCCELNDLNVNIGNVDDFIDIFSNFKDISSEINLNYINKRHNMFLRSITHVKKFINDLSLNISYDNLLDKDQFINDFKDEFELSNELIGYSHSDNYDLKDEELIKEFIDIYSDLDNIVKIINDEVKRRDSLFNYYADNKNRIGEFVYKYKRNISSELYIDDYQSVLNEYSSIYETCYELKNLKFIINQEMMEFIYVYSNFKHVSAEINLNYINKRYNIFLKSKNQVKEFINTLSSDISYDNLLDKDQFINDFKDEFELSNELIGYSHSDNYDLKDEELIKKFIDIYSDLENIVKNINDEVKRRDSLFNYYADNKNNIEEFINKYKVDISSDLYIDDYKSVLNEYSSIYQLCCKLNIIEANFDKTIIDEFIKIYSNFKYISSKINKAYIDKVYDEFNHHKENINEFCNKFKFNIPYNLIVDADSKSKELSKVSDEYDISKRLVGYKKSDNYSLIAKDKKLIDNFTYTYENFDFVINKINNGYEKRMELRNSFFENQNSILSFISDYKTEISDELYIEDYESILKDFSNTYSLCDDLNILSQCYSFDINEKLINKFLEIYNNFEDVSVKINENYFKNKYNIFLKSKNEMQKDMDDYEDLNADLYLKNKEFCIENFKIKKELSDILLNFKEKLNKADLTFISDYIVLYNQFNGKYVEENNKRFKNIKHVLTKTINKYTTNLSYDYYIADKKEYLKKYETNINFVSDILKLHENNELKLDDNDLEKIHNYLNLFDNFDGIIAENNYGYAEKIYEKYLEIKNKVSYFVKRYENTPLLKSYIDKSKKKKILKDNSDNYKLLDEIVSIPESSKFCKKRDTKLIDDFLDIYNDFDNVILDINKRFVINLFEENLSEISEYVDLVDLSQDFYVSNMKLNDLLDNYSTNQGLVKKILGFCKDYPYLEDKTILNQFPLKSAIKKKYKKANESFVERELKTNKKFFNNINGYSLDDQQREAVVVDEDTNQIIAGAGTGKTLTLQAKVKYLINKRGINANEIVALSYSNASVDDLKNKISEDIDIRTIHSLGHNILEKNGEQPNADNNAINKVIDEYFLNEVLNDAEKSKRIIEFYSYYRYPPTELDDFSTKGELYQKEAGRDFESLKSKSFNYMENDYSESYVTFNREYVKSLEELYIANYLYINGVDYKYERIYEGKTDEYYLLFNFIKFNSKLPLKEKVQLSRDIAYELDILEEDYVEETRFKKYKPDFYLPEYDIYIEHFGVDKNCRANWLNKEDADKYSEQIEWKRNLHKKYGTNLLETYSYYQRENRLLDRLKEKLTDEGVIFNPIDYSELYQNLVNHQNLDKISDLIKLIKTFINHFKGNNLKKSEFKKIKKLIDKESSEFVKMRHTILLNIIKDVFDNYQKYLKKNKLIDFNDMINKAQKSIEKKGCPLNYKYILVDEYQDVSYTRYSLIKSIQDAINSKVVVVGDDWQSIYRFSGCDLGLFSQIDEYFEHVETRLIEQTYRNSQELINVSGDFVMKNPLQITKELHSNKNIENPIKIAYFDSDPEEILVFKALIDTIISSDDYSGGEILVLGRNRRDIQKLVKGKFFDDEIFTYTGTIDSNFDRNKFVKLTYLENEDINIKYRTIHGSKGLQADYVIVINLKNNLIGFPNKIEDDPILQYVKLSDEPFEYAEERRLFYVSLTRTKGNCYLLTPKLNKSEFIEELEENDEHIEYIEQSFLDEILNSNVTGSKYISLPTKMKCPECRTGDVKLMWHADESKRFLTCSHNHCDWVGGSYSGDFEDLNEIFSCPVCGDVVVKRSGSYGPFFACTNGLCEYTMDDFSHPSYEVHKTKLECPVCNSKLKLIYSDEFEKGSFICSNDDCSHNVGKFFGDLDDLEIYGLCPDCDGILIKKNGSYGEFLGCSNWKKHGGCTYSRNISFYDEPFEIFK